MRGRPLGSQIRNNIIKLLKKIKKGHGYIIYKEYCKTYPQVTQRSIYYHLNKGLTTGEFQIAKKAEVKGNYSWGTRANVIIYKLGKNYI